MAVSLASYQIVLIVIILIGIILVIHAAWVLAELNKTVGDQCLCSGVSDQEISSLRVYTIIGLLVGIGAIIFGVIMFFIPSCGSCDDKKNGKNGEMEGTETPKVKSRIASRFANKTE